MKKDTKNKYENIQAAAKVVICVPMEAYKTKSGMELSTNGTDKPETGNVVAFGEGKKPIEFEVGDTIVFRKYTDNRIFLGDTEFNFILFKDVLGVIKK
jgi:chaperonin GroES